MQYIKNFDAIPVHCSVLQALVSHVLPKEEQSLPPLRGAGELQYRVLECIPPPQETEHEPNALHCPYPPFTLSKFSKAVFQLRKIAAICV